MPHSAKRPKHKKRKLSIENEDDSNDVDDPCEVDMPDIYIKQEAMGESSNDIGDEPVEKKIKLASRNENDDNDDDDDDGREVNRECKAEIQETNINNCESGPPVKKFKLSADIKEKNRKIINYINRMQASNEKDNEEEEEEETDHECNYENMDANFFAEELTSDDEIFTFQCPENFDLNSLLNKTIDLSKNVKLKDGINKYVLQTSPNCGKEKLSFVVPSKENGAVLLKLPLAGHLLLRRVVKSPKKSVGTFVDMDPDSLHLPVSDSMKRHPLLGTEWNDHLNKARKQLKKHKKFLRRSIKHEKSLVKAEKERKEQKKRLKVELTLLKKKQISDIVNS